MDFRFEPLRATQAAAFLARLKGGRVNYTWLLKVLYLADRRSLIETGNPITGDHVVNMKNGPVLSALYDCVKGKGPGCTTWARYFQADGRYEIVLRGEPGDSELSDYDVDVLVSVFEGHRDDDVWAMIDLVHKLPEWTDPEPEAKQAPLSYETILEAAGVSSETISGYESLNDTLKSLDEFRIVRG